ncbi:dienelactone hydrolase family protein [Caulobacter sp. S45]|jgi:carboxymethylenebutenolidase|uniref:dienelactone hydrolase family protein n=1 Tax=Caulobacter sp. S45 TaxID=1641861 RepID=UPI00131D60B7|nr:dienelactone hydrolase family protein [Caulobacter sp. S45]
MSREKVSILAKDGQCAAYVLTPEGNGPWPAIIFYMDAFGIRPAMMEMAAHLADEGYVVLLPDLLYRFGPYGPLVPKEVMAGDFRAVIGPMMASTDNHKTAEDTAAFLAYLDSRSDVAGDKVGTVGFCMGGGMALTAAGYYPDRVAAAVSFHGGNLATDAPTSPHLLAPKIKAEVYVAGADNDHSYPPEMAERTEKALTDAGVKHRCEIYEGKAHGWMKPDMPVYDAEAAERGWREAFALFDRNLH